MIAAIGVRIGVEGEFPRPFPVELGSGEPHRAVSAKSPPTLPPVRSTLFQVKRHGIA